MQVPDGQGVRMILCSPPTGQRFPQPAPADWLQFAL